MGGFPNIPLDASEVIVGLHDQAESQEKIRGALNAGQLITPKSKRNGGQQGAGRFCVKD
jgi:hypothetical protein